MRIFIFILCFFALSAFAEICPTPTEIRNNLFNGWQAYDINNGTAVSNERLEKFKTNVQKFSLAEWMKDALEGAAHCYYDPHTVDIYLAKNNLIYDKNFTFWHAVGYDDLQCNSSIELCNFVRISS